MLQVIVDGGKIEIHFTGELRLEVFDFKIDDDEAAQMEMIEKQVEKEVLVANFERILTANERKTLAKFQEEIPQLLEQAAFKIAFRHLRSKRQEIKIIWDP